MLVLGGGGVIQLFKPKISPKFFKKFLKEKNVYIYFYIIKKML